MKEYSPGLLTRVRNLFVTQQKVLLWSVWRSGTHWVADVMSDMLGIPAVHQHTEGADYRDETLRQLETAKRNTILLRHVCMMPEELLAHTDRLGYKVVFLYRDPRDVVASHVNMRKYREGYRAGLPPFPDMEIHDILEWEMNTLGGLYTGEIPQWAATRHPRLLKLRYEDLLADPGGEFAKLSEFLGLGLAREQTDDIAERNSFARAAGRKAGTEDKTSHARKGVVGDFRNQFTKEEQAMLNTLLEDALKKMNYEVEPGAGKG